MKHTRLFPLMKIGIFTDLRFTQEKNITGVGKHVIQMSRGLANVSEYEVSMIGTCDQLNSDGSVPSENSLATISARSVPWTWKKAEAFWTMTGLPKVDRWCGSPDWVYCPKNDYIPVSKTRVAVTVHGAHELDPELNQAGDFRSRINRLRRRISYRRILSDADLILTVSEFLKGQIVDWFSVSEEKIRVVGNGVENVFFDVAQDPIRSIKEINGDPFVLTVGGLNDLDGGDRVISTARVLQEKQPDVKIYVAGNQHNEKWKYEASQLKNIIFLGFVEAEKLARYMHNAAALFFPTRYETFGIALGEAMAAGCPVVTSESTAVPEIAGNAAIYVDGNDSQAAAEALEVVISDTALRKDLIKRGISRAEKYRWSSCVNRLQHCLETY